MNISELHAKSARVERELAEARELLAQANHVPEAITREPAQTRAYAFGSETLSVDEVVDNEVKVAQAILARNLQALGNLLGPEWKNTRALGSNEQELLRNSTTRDNVELRPVRRVEHPPKLPNDIVWLPKYAGHLANPHVVAAARRVLDDHLRIAQLHLRILAASTPDGTPGGFGAVKHRGRADTREWHTDWPHDPQSYGRDDPGRNVGCIR